MSERWNIVEGNAEVEAKAKLMLFIYFGVYGETGKAAQILKLMRA